MQARGQRNALPGEVVQAALVGIQRSANFQLWTEGGDVGGGLWYN